MKIIMLLLTLEMGIIPAGHLRMYDFNKDVYPGVSFYGDYNFEVQMFDNHFFYGIGNKIFIWKVEEGKSFKPDAINFIFFAGLRFGDNVEIGFRHYCQHPIAAWANGNIDSTWERWYEEVYIKLNFSLFED